MNLSFIRFQNNYPKKKPPAGLSQNIINRGILNLCTLACLIVSMAGGLITSFAQAQDQAQDSNIRQAAPAIWKMSDEDSEVWLLGTYHILPPNLNWRSSPVLRGIKDAQSIYLEADVDSPSAQLNMMRAMVLNGFQKKGHKLSNQLTKSQIKKLNDIANELHIPFKAFDDMRPWNVYLTISVQFIVNKGFDPQGGVDSSISQQARAQNIPLNYFETAEQQISFFADLPEELELSLLTATLADWEKLNAEFEILFDAWANGDVMGMDDLINESLKQTSPELYDVILVNRNKDWISSIDNLMSGDGKHLIAVGAGHLVGNDSVINLLRQKGYKIERILE